MQLKEEIRREIAEAGLPLNAKVGFKKLEASASRTYV